jgi:metal-dependent amidase/aminoacylase/carboxypeptidase family protein
MQLTQLEDIARAGMTPALALYLDLHRNPELSGRESRTAGLLAAWLSEAGYEISTGIGGDTGPAVRPGDPG